MRYRNPSVVERIVKEEGVSYDVAELWFREMLKFLAVAPAVRAEGGYRAAPPMAVDAAWHAFILHTRDYAAFCEQELGEFIHHTPTAAPDIGAAVDYMRTRALAEERFGPLDTSVWPRI